MTSLLSLVKKPLWAEVQGPPRPKVLRKTKLFSSMVDKGVLVDFATMLDQRGHPKAFNFWVAKQNFRWDWFKLRISLVENSYKKPTKVSVTNVFSFNKIHFDWFTLYLPFCTTYALVLTFKTFSSKFSKFLWLLTHYFWVFRFKNVFFSRLRLWHKMTKRRKIRLVTRMSFFFHEKQKKGIKMRIFSHKVHVLFILDEGGHVLKRTTAKPLDRFWNWGKARLEALDYRSFPVCRISKSFVFCLKLLTCVRFSE